MDAMKSLAGKASESILNPESMKAAADKESIEQVEEDDDDAAEFPVPDAAEKQQSHADSCLQLQQKLYSWGIVPGPA